MKKSKIYYLASPYSFKSRFKVISWFMRTWRYVKVTKFAAKLTKELGIPLILPITQSHNLAKYEDFDTGFNSWKKIDLRFIDVCQCVLVLQLSGWELSQGVKAEIKYALQTNKPVVFVTLDSDLRKLKL